ncbi:hypothetical protein BDA96_02G350900 [Sorghum bicolor]|uniref:F-box domain-containing protein n=2 Tax=Sorghum bicolor TaxID=4558 RepID=A0A921RSY1_SORBI|nr:uncharacterized protein LOC8056313 [Sorghum bicolor]EER97355.2 hypothetical protein SORBI_3002G334600 [Sorghum bicolor]KAG0545315.1 hypothetical protein BDA96_02G350900 [Sorghum bicolor]|eukprot:XP_002463003.2 uncharacterized protein LOC8056313 [Sorghum bicolor]
MASLAAAGEALPFSDDILAEIFIRLPTLEDLGRACASCPAFRRVITSHSFLRRLHALHPPSLLGFLTFSSWFHPTESSRSSARAASAVAEAADFEFSFLPTKTKGSWMVRDALGGRFVLDCDDGAGSTFTTIAVCDPLFRRHVILPPLPQGLAAAVEQPLEVDDERRCDVFLAPCSEEGAQGAPQAFSVIWMAHCQTKLVAFIFSSASWQWRAIAPRSWRDLNPAMRRVIKESPLQSRSYAYGCFYWCLSEFHSRSKLIMLDVGRMEFCPVNHPFSHRLGEFAVVELGESRRGMFMLGDNTSNEGRIVQLFSASNQIHGEGASQWVLENTVRLYCSRSFKMLGVADGKLLLQGASEHKSEEKSLCISLDFKTRQVQGVRGIIHSGHCPMVVRYIGYPPSLSLPTI